MGDGVSDLVKRGEGWASKTQKREADIKEMCFLLWKATTNGSGWSNTDLERANELIAMHFPTRDFR